MRRIVQEARIDVRDRSLDDTIPNGFPAFGGRPRKKKSSPTSPLTLDAAGLSDKGKVRETNQDHFLIARAGRYLETIATSLPAGEIPSRYEEAGHVLLVADGMGGVAGGEVASRVAIATLVNVVRDMPDWIMRVDEASGEEVMRRAVDTYRRVNAALSERARSEPVLSGMGTTMTAARTVGSCLFVTHVGDSRAYLYRDHHLTQLTTDHTGVQRLVDAGVLTREQAATHQMRHVLTNVLGGKEDVDLDVEVQRVGLREGDGIVLCSDGLTEVVDDSEIARVLGRADGSEAACRALVDVTLERGAPDNVTVVVGRCRADRTGAG